MVEGKRRGRPVGGNRVSREAIVETALRLADLEGLDAVTMRRLGEALEVDPMTIYHHIPNRAALLDAIVEAVLREARAGATPSPSRQTWQERAEERARSYRAALLRHPNVLGLLATRQAQTAFGFDAIERWLQELVRAGFEPATALDAITCITTFTTGQTLVDAVGGSEGTREQRRGHLRGNVDPEKTPTVAELLRAGPRNREVRFGLGLHALITGLDTLRHPR